PPSSRSSRPHVTSSTRSPRAACSSKAPTRSTPSSSGWACAGHSESLLEDFGARRRTEAEHRVLELLAEGDAREADLGAVAALVNENHLLDDLPLEVDLDLGLLDRARRPWRGNH